MSSYTVNPRLYVHPFDDRVLVFNPSKYGRPFLLAPELAWAVQRCHQTPETELLSHFPAWLQAEEKLKLLSFLQKLGVLSADQCGASPEQMTEQKRMWSVWLHITNECNLRCPYCFVQKSQQAMTHQTIQRVVSQLLDEANRHAISNITIKFAGGEPLLRLDLIRYTINAVRAGATKEQSVTYTVLSNGTCLNHHVVEYLRTTGIGIGISLDGLGDVHDRTRKDVHGKGSFAKIAEGIRHLKSAGIPPYIMATLSEETVEELPRLTRWLLDEHLRSRYSFVRYDTYAWSDYQRFNKKIIAGVQSSIAEIRRHPWGPAFVLRWQLADLAFVSPIHRQPCGVAESHVIIDHEGNLALCPMSLKEPIGAIADGIVTQYAYHAPRYDQTMPRDPCCQSCRWHPVCGTGCPLLNEALQGHPNARSPFCKAYRYLIPAYIQLYGWALATAANEREAM